MADFSRSTMLTTIGESMYSTIESQLSDDQDEENDNYRFIVVGQRCRSNDKLRKALEVFSQPIIFSDTGLEYLNEAEDGQTIFVLENFSGNIFHRLQKAGARIFGPPVIIKCATEGQFLPSNARPLYCTSMKHLVLCFTGFKSKDELSHLADLVHHMGGGIRRDFSARVTHLVANRTGGDKYRVAVSMGTPIMGEDWVIRCWENRDDHGNHANDDNMMNHKLGPFSFATLSFLGFTSEEQRHMRELTVENGGTCADVGSPLCTHLVVDEQTIKTTSNIEKHQRLYTVKSEWFWGSIQIDACADESLYLFEEPLAPETPATGRSSATTPKTLSGSKSRKRKLKENLALLAAEGEMDSPAVVMRKSNEFSRMSFSASFLDATAEMSSHHTPQDVAGKENEKLSPREPQQNKMSARQLTVMELLQTERNYVGILQTILKVFRDEIERQDQPGGALLEPTDVKLIFGKIPPIHDVHVLIRDELENVVANWTESSSVGDVFLNHADDLLKAYPPFVNFFESTKETIARCEKAKPRFHAFLKVCQSKPECGRQTLTELLIRPVQRLPSVMLLLKDILKRTDRSSGDFFSVEKAIEILEEVMTHINEDKRKAEGHQRMFDIVNDIDNCPPNLLSSHRVLVLKVDVIELAETLTGRGEPVTLFIFNDSMEMCKRRIKVLNAKSPMTMPAKTPQKAYKHLELISLSCVKRVVDVVETKECKNAFALVTKELNKKERLFAFTLVEDETDKSEFLRTLSKNISASMCRADYENLLAQQWAVDLQLDTTDIHNRTLSKAATKFGKRVSRAFSFNKTPRKLKRAMSSMSQVMSPFRRESMSFVGNTPHGDLRGMRLASVNDLTMMTPPDSGLSQRVPLAENLAPFAMPDIPEPSFKTPNKKRRDTLARRETLAGFSYASIRNQFRKERLPSVTSLRVSSESSRYLAGSQNQETSAMHAKKSCKHDHSLVPGTNKTTELFVVPSTSSMHDGKHSPCLESDAKRRKVYSEESESPIPSIPSTPNLSSHLKAATLGHHFSHTPKRL